MNCCRNADGCWRQVWLSAMTSHSLSVRCSSAVLSSISFQVVVEVELNLVMARPDERNQRYAREFLENAERRSEPLSSSMIASMWLDQCSVSLRTLMQVPKVPDHRMRAMAMTTKLADFIMQRSCCPWPMVSATWEVVAVKSVVHCHVIIALESEDWRSPQIQHHCKFGCCTSRKESCTVLKFSPSLHFQR